MQKDRAVLRYEEAAAILPICLRKAALELPEEQKAQAEEFRLRTGKAMTILLPTGEVSLGIEVTPEDLDILCDLATEFSRYAAAETLREGFLSVRGGFRVGLCGSAVIKNGVNTNLKSFSSASIRISREKKGIAVKLIPQLFRENRFINTLIISPPGGGKTTLLRDVVRCLSEKGIRISLIDERGEIAVMYRGEAQLDVGSCTDILDACPKAIGIPMVLRAMNPQIIAVDEITALEDIKAMALAVGCGVGLLATIHAGNVGDLLEKSLYRELLSNQAFQQAVLIRHLTNERTYVIEELPCLI